MKKQLLALTALLFSSAGFSQSYFEGADLPGTGTGPAFTVFGPITTIGGTLNTSADIQDRFQIIIPAGCQVTGASWSMTDTANINANGFAQFGIMNQEPFPPLNGNFALGPFQQPFPVSQGTYDCMMVANVAANDVWSITFYSNCPTGITDVNFTEAPVVNPNPATDRIFFSTPMSGTFTLTNMLGQTLQAIALNPDVCASGISVADLPAGVYYYAITGEDERRGKFAVE